MARVLAQSAVIPAQAGIQGFPGLSTPVLGPRLRGDDGGYACASSFSISWCSSLKSGWPTYRLTISPCLFTT